MAPAKQSKTKPKPKVKPKAAQAAKLLRAFALSYPGTREEFPWGERVVKVGKKVFVFMGMPEAKGLSLSVKLSLSANIAMMFPFAKPTGYGLGKSGWVSASFEAGDVPPLDLLRIWIDESYRAIAPKSLVGGLPAMPDLIANSPRTGQAARRRTGAKSSRSTATGR
jgi:predicted DNA-binding protein (MmcQ/YjbR family)